MSDNGRDFWSDEIAVESLITPEVILREQAGILAEKTEGIVRGEVETIEQPAEKVDEYLKPVFTSEAEIKRYTHTLPYPCRVVFHPGTAVNSTCPRPGDLFAWLSSVLKHSTTTRIIRALISRATQPRQAASGAN